MRKYRSFRIETCLELYKGVSFSFLRAQLVSKNPGGSIGLTSLPDCVELALTGPPALYRVKRVCKGTRGACEVRVRPDGGDHIARYVETGGGICKRLARLVGYPAKKPATIYVTITKVRELIDAHS